MGKIVGAAVGNVLGTRVGTDTGMLVGTDIGTAVGIDDGTGVGNAVGSDRGTELGTGVVGREDGTADGTMEGFRVKTTMLIGSVSTSTYVARFVSRFDSNACSLKLASTASHHAYASSVASTVERAVLTSNSNAYVYALKLNLVQSVTKSISRFLTPDDLSISRVSEIEVSIPSMAARVFICSPKVISRPTVHVLLS